VCNDFGNNVPYIACLKAFSEIRVPIVFPIAAPNLEPRDDRTGARFSALGAWGGAGSTALGVPAGKAQGCPGDQFPFRGAPVPERALPYPGVALLRVCRQEGPVIEVEFTKTGEDWFCFAGLWRPMPDGAGTHSRS
jgi:hypothetical protein